MQFENLSIIKDAHILSARFFLSRKVQENRENAE